MPSTFTLGGGLVGVGGGWWGMGGGVLVITLCTVAVNRTFVFKVHTTGRQLDEVVAL